jgi:hypothetical protein
VNWLQDVFPEVAEALKAGLRHRSRRRNRPRPDHFFQVTTLKNESEKHRACFTVLLMTDGCLLLSGTAFAHQCLRNVLILSRG